MSPPPTSLEGAVPVSADRWNHNIRWQFPVLQEVHHAPWRQVSYSDKQKRQAEHIEAGYESRGMPEKEAERRAWATVNKDTGGGNKSGSGRGNPDSRVSARGTWWQGRRRRRPADRSAAAKKAAATRKRHAEARTQHAW